MTSTPAPGFIAAKGGAQMAKPLSIYGLKAAEAAKELAAALAAGRVVPLARTKSSGEVIEVIAFAVPADLLARKAICSDAVFEWRRVRRHPREAAETARLKGRALEVEGLADEDLDDIRFFIVPDDAEPLFSDIGEDHEAAKIAAIRRIADGLEELVSLMRPKLTSG